MCQTAASFCRSGDACPHSKCLQCKPLAVWSLMPLASLSLDFQKMCHQSPPFEQRHLPKSAQCWKWHLPHQYCSMWELRWWWSSEFPADPQIEVSVQDQRCPTKALLHLSLQLHLLQLQPPPNVWLQGARPRVPPKQPLLLLQLMLWGLSKNDIVSWDYFPKEITKNYTNVGRKQLETNNRLIFDVEPVVFFGFRHRPSEHHFTTWDTHVKNWKHRNPEKGRPHYPSWETQNWKRANPNRADITSPARKQIGRIKSTEIRKSADINTQAGRQM